MENDFEVVNLRMRGKVKDICGTRTFLAIAEKGVISQEITTDVLLEVESEIKKIHFYGYLPSQLIGEEVEYYGAVTSGSISGRRIIQVSIKSLTEQCLRGLSWTVH